MVEDEQVNCGSQVVDVGNKDVLFPFSNEFVQEPGVLEAGIDVSVPWWVPGLSIFAAGAHALSNWQEGLLVDPRIPIKKIKSPSFRL